MPRHSRATALSRLLGLVRTLVFSQTVGRSCLGTVYVTANQVPNLDPRVQALLGACCILALRPAGFTSRDLRHLLAPSSGRPQRT